MLLPPSVSKRVDADQGKIDCLRMLFYYQKMFGHFNLKHEQG